MKYLKSRIKYFFRLIINRPVWIFNLLLIITFLFMLYLLSNQYRFYHENELMMTPKLSGLGGNASKNIAVSNDNNNSHKIVEEKDKELLIKNIQTDNNEKEVEDILKYLSVSSSAPAKVRDDSKNWFDILQETAQHFYSLFSNNNHHLEELRSWAIEKQRVYLQTELSGYSPYDKTKKFDDYIMEKGGRPKINAIFTTWRSGSTFLAEVIEAIPGTMYHYEPLLHFDIVRVRSGALAKEGIRVLHDLFNCEYANLSDYVKYGEEHHWLHSHNNRVWQYCEENHQICSDSNFLSKMCKMFPFQILKTVRMRLKLAKIFLDDPKLNLKILLLVRDPRGTLQSRRHREWCPGNPDCDSPTSLCFDLEDDFRTARKFRKLYPGRFMALRYEDISLNPYSAVKKIFQFFELTYDSRIDDYLANHTVADVGGVSSTFRDSKNAPFHWKKETASEFEQVEKIQSICSRAMTAWGYKPALNNFHVVNFNPLGNPPWKNMIIESDNLNSSSVLEIGQK